MRLWGLAGITAFCNRRAVAFEFFGNSSGLKVRCFFSGGLKRRTIAVLAACALVVGCAEVHHRGGVLAKIADKVIFPASGKGHRVLRAYVVFGALVSIASYRGIPSGDKLAFQARVVQTMDNIKGAFICAYETTSGCIFFDEKMARVDYNLFKLALSVLVTSESRALVTELQRELLPKVPVVGSTLLAASSAADTAGHVATAGVETVQVVESLIKLGYQAAETVGPLFPIYRDAQELDMVVAIDMLARRCGAGDTSVKAVRDANPYRDNLYDYGKKAGLPTSADCNDFVAGMNIYKQGNGYLEEWRQFTATIGAIYLADMTPSSDHFVAVSSMITANCEQLFTPLGTNTDTTKSNTVCGRELLFVGTATGNLATAQQTAAKYALHEPAMMPVITPVASVSGSNPVTNTKAKLNTMRMD